MSALVSILIPARGDLEYFQYTIESIEKLEFCDFELILVDDGISVDKKIWIAKYFESRTRFHMIKNNGAGIVDALNTGISHCTSPFIARLDADDCIRPDRLTRQVNFLKANPSVGVVGSQVTYINENGAILGQSQYPSGFIFNSPKTFKACPIAHPSVMIRREVLEKAGGYLSLFKQGNYDLAEDFFLWLRISRFSTIFNLEESLTYYRQHDTQVSVSKKSLTLIASLLVYIKSLDSLNIIETPIHFRNSRIHSAKQIHFLCFRRFHLFTLLLLHVRLLEVRTSSPLLIFLIGRLGKFLWKVTGFDRVQN